MLTLGKYRHDTQKSNFRKPSGSIWIDPKYRRFAVSRADIELLAHDSRFTRAAPFLVRSIRRRVRRKVAFELHSYTHIHSPNPSHTTSDPPRSSTLALQSRSSSSPYARPTFQQPAVGISRLTSHLSDVGTPMTMLPRPPSAALPRELAYTQSAQYTHPPLFPLFRRASTPRTEVLDDQVPHQTDGTLMRGPAGRAAVVLGRLPSRRGECISRLARAQNTPHNNSTGSWTRVSLRIDTHEKAKLAESCQHCSALRAAQGLPNGDPA